MGREINRPRKLFEAISLIFFCFHFFFLQSKVKTLPSLLSLSLSLKHSSLLGCYDEFADAGGGGWNETIKTGVALLVDGLLGFGFFVLFPPSGFKGWSERVKLVLRAKGKGFCFYSKCAVFWCAFGFDGAEKVLRPLEKKRGKKVL